MARNWAVTIGINHYRYLPPLKYGMSDADAVQQFFEQELQFHQIYHFTDSSPPISQDYGPDLNSQPTSTTLGRFLRKRFEQPFLSTGDNLWFFFAGHGIRHENRDYLMPIDGDRDDLARSAISLNYVSERLQRSGADNVILLIDACRNEEGRRDSVGFGEEKQQGVITLYSCSPQEAAYEIEEIKAGAFTHALIQSLRLQGEGNCATVERLYQRLRYHVPQLTRSYRRMSQTPYGRIEPPSKSHLILLPQQATLTDVIALKNDALKSEVERDFQTARHLWIRVLIVSPGDPDAVLGIERLASGGTQPKAKAKPTPAVSPSKPNATASRSVVPNLANQDEPLLMRWRREAEQSRIATAQARSSIQSSPSQQPRTRTRSNGSNVLTGAESWLNRRRVLQIVGLSGGGLAAAIMSRFAFRSESADSPLSAVQSLPIRSRDFSPITFETVKINQIGEVASRETKSSHLFREKVKDITIDLIPVPGGTFRMGAADDSRSDNARPQRTVNVTPFLMGRYEITQEQWRAVSSLSKVDLDIAASPSRFKGDKHPVENVSWLEAKEFCRRLTRYSDREYRLPSEAEWEYACRAGTNTPFYFGETLTSDVANYDASYGEGPKGQDRSITTEVGSFSPNALGLYDMHGNVYEWCLDTWHDSYIGAPSDGSAWITESTAVEKLLRGKNATKRLVRGGSWIFSASRCRSASREEKGAAMSSSYVGFRVVCAAPWTLT